MPEDSFPTLEEFWERVDVRGLEPDLRDRLRERTSRENLGVQRLPAATTVAVMARLLPDTVPPEALAAFVDRYFDEQLGRCNETVGVLVRGELIPLGFAVLDTSARARHGSAFAELLEEAQDELLADAESGELEGPDGFDAARWFELVRNLALLALGSDPRGMVLMGFPGPTYQTGHIWLDEEEVAARAARRRGYLRL